MVLLRRGFHFIPLSEFQGPPLSASDESQKDLFTSYGEALQHVRDTYDGDNLQTPESSWIGSGEYYHADGLGYFILNVKTGSRKSYIHQGVPAGVWEGFRAAQSNATMAEQGLWSPVTEPSGKMVYITSTGSKYHRDGCRYLDKSKVEVNTERAVDLEYDPCKVCKP